DFLKLYQKHGCLLQLGGSDQWGNITSGIELLRREEEVQGFGLTMPLITQANGKKFGKTEGNAIWLDADKTSPYEYYQFWLNTDDRDAVKFLKYFTFLSLEEIAEIEKEFSEAPAKRGAQKDLAKDETTLVHGQKAYEQAVKISAALFSGDIKTLSAEELEQAFSDVPAYQVKPTDSLNLVEILITAGIEPSKRQAREDIKNGAIYLNGQRLQDISYELQMTDKLSGKSTIIRRGKKKYFILRF